MFPRLLYSLLLAAALVPLVAAGQASLPPSLRSQLLNEWGFAAGRSDTLQPDLAVSTSPPGSRSPLLATLLSAAIPGTGQIYVQRYWTIPLIWGFGYWFVRQYNFADSKYDEWRVAYSRSLTEGPFAGSGDGQAKYIRDFYRNERDRFAFYLAITYVLNLVDAYVGASLYNFDVSEDLTGGNQVRLEVRIPIR